MARAIDSEAAYQFLTDQLRMKCPQIHSCPMDGEYPSCKACQRDIKQEATTALSTFQTKNENLRAESIMHHNAADNYFAELTEYRQERNEALAELEQVKHALAMMWFAYVNSDKETPHSYETEAIEEAERLLGPWEECMPKYLRRD